ncbi:MAG: GatB/YqeY domain-containing protein [Minisyncoccales bacterium]
MKEKIQKDLWRAIKSNEERKVSVLRLLLNEISKKETEKRYFIFKKKPFLSEEELKKESLLSEEEIIKIILSEIKKRKESIENFQKAQREDLVLKEEKEIEILKEYLPDFLSEGEIEKIVKETIGELLKKGEVSFGLVMKEVLKKVAGQAESTLVSLLVKKNFPTKK